MFPKQWWLEGADPASPPHFVLADAEALGDLRGGLLGRIVPDRLGHQLFGLVDQRPGRTGVLASASVAGVAAGLGVDHGEHQGVGVLQFAAVVQEPVEGLPHVTFLLLCFGFIPISRHGG
ncbi:hypothetical protein C0580_02670 [Candidatus Parcubacteria bacterium]|nr:MAG: hypothetical protein C0580_02670 [Candidatus Parcubacteria bacterium]